MRAILVEDDEHLRRITRDALASLGFTKNNGDDLRTGLSVLTQWAMRPPPELLITDICLPGDIDGIEVLQKVRAARIERDWWPEDHVPAVVVTSGIYKPYNGVADTIRDLRAVFLPKPYTLAQLKVAIEEAQYLAAEWDTVEGIETIDEDLPTNQHPA